jgi:hypothetical protein
MKTAKPKISAASLKLVKNLQHWSREDGIEEANGPVDDDDQACVKMDKARKALVRRIAELEAGK